MSATGRALVVGIGVAGESVARQLLARGWAVTAVDDRPTEAGEARARGLAGLGASVLLRPSAPALARAVDAADLVVPSPGIPASHPATSRALTAGTTVWSEFELASRWSEVPFVVITGTNGKTTVTTLVEEMLRESGRRTVAAGNNDLPLVDALDLDLDVIVVEASSFRLEFTETFRPAVATWLNLAEDHLDWHGSMERYHAAKARIWRNQTGADVAVANADDAAVMAAAKEVRSALTTFGLGPGAADWRLDGGDLVGPGGPFVRVEELPRALPHDLANALAAAATATAAGAEGAAVHRVLTTFGGLPHRLTLVVEHGGVRYYDDSKATDPHASATAVASFASAVLIAGGRNKGLDLGVLAEGAGRLRAVVAIGEAGPEVVTAFSTTGVPVATASSMDDAVAAARRFAEAGDAVLLSPGCASYDWYGGYAERGDDFARAVLEAVEPTG